MSTKNSKLDDEVKCLLKGRPPHPATVWTKPSLINVLVTLATTQQMCKFIDKVICVGNSPFKHRSAVYKIFKLWKSTNEGPREHGRPKKMAVGGAQDEVSNVF